MCSTMKEKLEQIKDFVLQVEKNVEKIKMNVVHIERIMSSQEVKIKKRDSHAPTAFMKKRHDSETENKRDSHAPTAFMKKRMSETAKKRDSHTAPAFAKKRDSHTAPAFAKRSSR